jgi:hypothetical protein
LLGKQFLILRPSFFVMRLAVAAAALGPIVATQPLEVRAARCVPLDLRFQYNLPQQTSSASRSSNINYGGYNWQLPAQGNLVSFYGNYRNGSTTSSQITTVTNSTPIQGGDSTSVGAAMANGTTIVSTTFSSGNASRYLRLGNPDGSCLIDLTFW